MDIQQNLTDSLLLEIYSKLLTDKQREILTEFYFDNNSISEIAQIHNSSRQAVNDLIKRSINVLHEYENKLGLLEKFNKIKHTVNDVLDNIDTIDKQQLSDALNKILEDM